MNLTEFIIERASDRLAEQYMDKVASAMYIEELLQKEAGPKNSEKKQFRNQVFANQKHSRDTQAFNQASNRAKGGILNSAKETAEMMTEDPKLQKQLTNQVTSYVGKPNNQPRYTAELVNKAENEKVFNQIEGVSKDTIRLGNKSAKKLNKYRNIISELKRKIMNQGLDMKDLESKLHGAQGELTKRQGIIDDLTKTKGIMQGNIDDLLAQVKNLTKEKNAVKEGLMLAQKSRMVPKTLKEVAKMMAKTKHGRIAAGILGGAGLAVGGTAGAIAGRSSKAGAFDEERAYLMNMLENTQNALDKATQKKGLWERLVG